MCCISDLELVAYFSCCRLQPSHAFLVLRRAMSVAWKAQNYITAASVSVSQLCRGGSACLLRLNKPKGPGPPVTCMQPPALTQFGACLCAAVLQFARRLLSGTYSNLKGAPEELAKAKKVLLVCEQKGTDAIPINYEPAEAGEPKSWGPPGGPPWGPPASSAMGASSLPQPTRLGAFLLTEE